MTGEGEPSPVDEARRVRDLENELRAAKAAASDAANAEARLRNMVASAEANAGKAFAAQLAAEEEADELRDRLAQLGAGAGSAEDDQASEADDPASQRQAYPFFDIRA